MTKEALETRKVALEKEYQDELQKLVAMQEKLATLRGQYKEIERLLADQG